MRTEGYIDSISDNGKIIARFPASVNSNTLVKDIRNKTIGKIDWIFGPVDEPYYEIEPLNKSQKTLSLIGNKIYVEEDNNGK
ncbi:MAG: H/ACA ribonucleoprotein complex subunit GAR1 [Thermoplasmata archaeon]